MLWHADNAPVFRRRKPPSGNPADIFMDLRTRALELDPAEAGIQPTEAHPHVWGVLMEMGMAGGVATLVGMADGTTSMYTSTGGGVIGGGEHESVARQTDAFLSVAEQHLDELEVEEGVPPLPSDGEVHFRVCGYAGGRGATVPEKELAGRESPLSPLFFAGHDVLTALRVATPPGG